jgi:uncharacterized membrane protein
MIDLPRGLSLWLHIASVTLLIGGAFIGRLAIQAAAATLAPDIAKKVSEATAERYRGWVFITVVALAATGIYNYLFSGGHSTRYHIVLGIKLLFALHIFTSAVLAVRPNNPRRTRQLAGVGISGLVVILIAVYLRQIA